ncbi:MAG: MBL fold metallo-hydrolase [Verrucomicrobiaceae bacterium]|nr:MAG: MBL fold metallo-hydrolase [Verrucomicrobiaceae bacterium]
MRLIDTGPGLMCAVRIPSSSGPRYMVYDAGHYADRGAGGYAKLQEVVPLGSTIDWLVLSHSDADHLGAVNEIMEGYTVKRVVRPTIKRDTGTWREADEAINASISAGETIQFVAGAREVRPGAKYRTGDATITFVCGFNEPPESWDLARNSSEWLNAGSILVRLVYAGRSILLTGDAVGRHIGDPLSSCIATERFAVDQARRVPIRSYVLVAPHHGADNGSSKPFIQEVKPSYVLFSAGHRFGHPRLTTALRYLGNGVEGRRMFRTDRGDDEGEQEWGIGRTPGTNDRAGDDDIDVTISETSQVSVTYREL